ncbi:hypothetical protein NLG97_g2143 [Lecanicillium saksenae]|uniref:Uncharacterized protein n=1 Tax=Lecanicillium saksenae TaxID=468837 RepID=A0ACC1R1T7_9HYPO|nr:hypothetical protein NLG97_g2143 [Lecanicillium saksenae]
MVFALASEALAKEDDDWFMWLEARAAFETAMELDATKTAQAKKGIERCNEALDRIDPDTNSKVIDNKDSMAAEASSRFKREALD